MPFAVCVAYCDADNNLQTFARVYQKYDGLPTDDVYREARGLEKDAEVTYDDLQQWEDSLCQTYESHVFEVPAGDIFEMKFENGGWCWPNVTPT